MKNFAWLAALALVSIVPAVAQAQYSGGSKRTTYRPQGPYNTQPLVVSKKDLSVFAGPLANPKFGTNEEAGFHMIRLPFPFTAVDESGEETDGEFVNFLQAGAAFGFGGGFEAGFFTPPAMVSPESEMGDLPLFASWGSSDGDIDFAVRTTLTVPLRSESRWRVNPGLHSLIRMDSGRADIGVFFPTVLISDDEDTPAEERSFASLEVPIRYAFKVGGDFFLGLETGLRKIDLTEGENDLFMPLGAFALYSLEAGKQRIDFSARFAWQSLFWLNPPEEWPDAVLEDTYTVTFGANIHFDLSGALAPDRSTKPAPSDEPSNQPKSNPDGVHGAPPPPLPGEE